MAIQLYTTPLSHFARKARILLDLYKVPYEIVDAGNVAASDSKTFADNPMMKVPVLIDGATWLMESDHIAGYLARQYDSGDRYAVNSTDVFDLNARAMINGVMDEEVKIILARRMGTPTEGQAFFDKALKAIDSGLAWLEENHARFNSAQPKYKEFHLLCLWEHLEYYAIFALNYPNLRRLNEMIAKYPGLRESSPFVLKPKS